MLRVTPAGMFQFNGLYSATKPGAGISFLQERKYPIARARVTYQMNKYLFFRGIVEYNKYRRRMLTDFLASFTYIPGTVAHAGYGSLYERMEWDNSRGSYVNSDRFMESQRGFFFKMSYLWRM